MTFNYQNLYKYHSHKQDVFVSISKLSH